MAPLTSSIPVHTLDGRILLSVGSAVTPEALETLILSNPDAPYKSHNLMGHGTVRKDMREFVAAPPYDTIFSERERTAEIFGELEEVRLVGPALEMLDHFKQNDFYSYRHFLTVFLLSSSIARELIPDHENRGELAATGPVHDIGKVCVSPDIIEKTTPLTVSEKRALDDHTIAGYVLLCYHSRETGGLPALIARDHHEKNDGSGYPQGIILSNLLVEIIAVSDVYDALLVPRPYRPTPYDNRTALEEIVEMATTGVFSWETVKVLVSHNRSSRPAPDKTFIPTDRRGEPPKDNVYGKLVDDD
ncbi:MAG: HD domain-containing phosphohydrolase [Thermodesulfobacteriota bacterium]